MIRHSAYIVILLFSVAVLSCKEDENNLPSVEERVSEAKAELKNKLTAPANGWRLQYQPTAGAGTFLMLLDFKEDGTVTIKSDVADNEGEFYEQTLPYRIDNALGLELILETYGVFHYMFEQDQASFGAEFEFVYEKEEGENLQFRSATDLGVPSVLVFEPAAANAENDFSREIAENLNAFAGVSPDFLERVAPIQQLVLNDRNISVFWQLDLAKRYLAVDFVAVGTTIEEIESENKVLNIYHESGYSLLNGKMVLKNPLSFTLQGQQITISEIALNNFDMSGPGFCSLNSNPSPKYTGQISGVGNVTLLSSYYLRNNTDFGDQSIFTVNVLFLVDENDNSLSESGIIFEKLPKANGFAFIYNVELVNDSIPSSSVGFFLDDGNLAMRQFEASQSGNLIKLSLTDTVYISGGSLDATAQDLIDVTDKIFEGGEIYAYNFSQQDVYRLFNPCNGYEIFLVR